MMKKRRILRNIIIAIIALVIIIPCGLLVHDLIVDQGKVKLECYYMMNDGKIKPLDRKIEDAEEEELIAEAVRALQEDPRVDGVSATVPKELSLLSAEVEGDTATLNFTQEYNRMKNVDEVICRSSLVWTLTSFEFIDNIRINVEGQPIRTNGGQPYDKMNRSNVLIGSVISSEPTEYAILKLYFANADGSDLVVEERVVEVSANQSREKTILEQLIAGPLEDGCYPTIPVETKIQDVTTTSDGTCYVNLSQDFVSKHNGGSTGELLTVYSIVNSLCEVDTVERVQFLIDGVKLDEFKGHIDFKTPFTAVSSLRNVQ